MDGDDLKIRDQGDAGQRNHHPASGIAHEQGNERSQQAQAVKLCQVRMCGRIFAKPSIADEDATRLRRQNERDQEPVLRDRFVLQRRKRHGENEQIVNHVE